MSNSIKTTTLVAVALAGLSACKKNDDKPLVIPAAPANAVQQAPAGMGMPKPAKKESQVIVPESVKGKWKSIRIVVVEIATKKETLHLVPVGKDYVIPGTGLTFRAENLLPDFSMGEGVITSKSDKPENPAAQVKIYEGGQERFRGWMFVKFPAIHSFEHPKYGLRLVEFVP